jgi:hypothetical protein
MVALVSGRFTQPPYDHVAGAFVDFVLLKNKLRWAPPKEIAA